jgi:ribosomal protein L37AE/L43A
MNLIFVCPRCQKTFESAAYRIVDNKGVIVDEHGNKTLDAKVAMDAPCPFCGESHVYAAGELACPFGAGDGHPTRQRNGGPAC